MKFGPPGSIGEGVGGADKGLTGISCSDRPKVLGREGDRRNMAPGVRRFCIAPPNKSAKLGVDKPKVAPADPGRVISPLADCCCGAGGKVWLL